MPEIRNGSRLYQIGQQVAETGTYRLYLCALDGRECLLQITTAVEHNGALQRAAFILDELSRRSDEIEVEYERVKKDPSVMLNYKLGFPELVDSFISQDQGGRQVNILAFRNVERVDKMVPLITITQKDGLRVDLRTSAWIMGKLLKLFVFAFSEGFSVDPTGNNILIEPDQHYVLIFDWSAAEIHPETVPGELQQQYISHAAQAVITVLGGDLETGIFPDDGEEGFKEYTSHLLGLARGGKKDAKRAYDEFYKLVDMLWERMYHPFASKPIEAR